MSNNLLSAHLVDEIAIDRWDNILSQLSPEIQFLNSNWYSSWGENYLPKQEPNSSLKYISIENNEQILHAICPCVSISRFGIKMLSTAGYYYPFRSFLFLSESVIDSSRSFVDAVHNLSKASIVRIGPAVVSDVNNQKLKDSFLNSKWKCHEINRGVEQVVNLPRSVEDFEKSLSKNLRKNLIRRTKRLSKLGQVKVALFKNCSSKEWARVIDQCADIESRSWVVDAADGKTRIYQKESFWKEYLTCKDACKRVAVWQVMLDEKPIAYSFAIDSGNCRYSISGQYDKEFRDYGVGIMVDKPMFEDAIESGMKIVNMGDGEAKYKDQWGVEAGSQLKDYVYFRPSVLGWIAYIGIRLKSIFDQ